ncbi:MAG: tocopherol cyclase family protein [Fibrobacterota bacterium]
MILNRIHRFFHPEIFQGRLDRASYFEGWYFKLVSADAKHALSVIPGIALSEKGRRAFIQVLDGGTGDSRFFDFDLRHFQPSLNRFEFRISTSVFSGNDIALNIWEGTHRVQGAIRFEGLQPFPVTLRSPGIMGWYAYVPFMECYHAVISMGHRLNGTLEIDRKHYDFTGGQGYIEKDWGRSFPRSWVWLQSNHFEDPSVSFMLSIADIPWLSRRFTGFLGYLRVGPRLYRFATYTGASVVSLSQLPGEVHVMVRDRRFQLEVTATAQKQGTLMAPLYGSMEVPIKESMDGEIELSLSDSKGRLIYEGKGIRAGMESHGKLKHNRNFLL